MGTVTGVEVTTWDPNFGHFNAFPFPLTPDQPGGGAPAYVELTPAGMFAAIREAAPEALIQVNHPRLEPNIGYFDQVGFDPASGRARGAYSDDYDLLEVWNGYDIGRPEVVDRIFQEWLALLEAGRRVVATGNSDSHGVRYYLAGYPRTFVYAPDGHVAVAAVLDALRRGDAFVSNGPFLEVVARGPERQIRSGEMVGAIDGFITLDVVVRAPAYMDVTDLEVFVGRTLVMTHVIRQPGPVEATSGAYALLAPPVERFRESLRVPVEGDATVVVRVSAPLPVAGFYGRSGVCPLAFTNPIFVDGDGDGVVPWLPPPPTPAADAGVDAGRDGGAAEVAGVPSDGGAR